jgi:hypothetical protein
VHDWDLGEPIAAGLVQEVRTVAGEIP